MSSRHLAGLLFSMLLLTPNEATAQESGRRKAASNYVYPNFQLRAAFRFNQITPIETIPLLFKHFEADYHNGGIICTTPFLALQARRLDVQGRTFQDLLDGTAESSIHLSSNLELREDRCRLGNFNVNCNSDAPLSSIPQDSIEINSHCNINWTGTPISIVVNSDTSIPNPLKILNRLDFDLPPKDPTSPNQTDLNFVGFANGQWTHLPPPQDKRLRIPVDGEVRFFGGVGTYSGPATNEYTGNDQFMLTNAFRSGTTTTSDIKLARFGGLTNINGFNNDPYLFASLEINQSVLANPDLLAPAGERGIGLFGSLFPLEIFGSYPISIGGKPQVLEARVVIGAASATISNSGGLPDIRIGLRIDSINVQVAGTGVELIPKPVAPFIKVLGPVVDQSGQLKFDSVLVGLNLDVLSGGQEVVLPVGDALSSKLNALLPSLASVRWALSQTTPECIKIDNERIDAATHCASEGGQTSRLMSLDTSETRDTESLTLDATKTAITAGNGELYVRFYRTF